MLFGNAADNDVDGAERYAVALLDVACKDTPEMFAHGQRGVVG